MGDPHPIIQGESVEDEKSSIVSDRIHLERIASFLPVPYYMGWLIIAVAYFLISNLFIIYYEKSVVYLLPSLMLSVLIFQQSIMIIWAKNKLDHIDEILSDIIDLPQDKLHEFWNEQMSFIFSDKKMVFSGILMNILTHLVYLDDFGYPYKTIYSYTFIKLGYYFVHYFMGAGLYLLFASALSIYYFSKLPLNINVLITKKIQFIGLLYSKFTACATSIYISWGIFYMTNPNRLSPMLSIIWFSCFAIILLFYFITPQYRIHQMTIDAKRIYLDGFSIKLRPTVKEALINPNRQNILCLRAIIEIQQQIDAMSEWPFGIYEILHIVLIIIIPFIVVVLELIFID